LHIGVVFELFENLTVLGAQVIWVDLLDSPLTHLKAGANLVWQPGCDWGTSSSSWVLRVVNDVLLNHVPMLVAEFESSVDVLEHQEASVTILGSILVQLSVPVLLSKPVD